MHIKVELPKKLTDKQIELLKAFEEEEQKDKDESKISATIEKAWDTVATIYNRQ